MNPSRKPSEDGYMTRNINPKFKLETILALLTLLRSDVSIGHAKNVVS